MIQGLYVNFFEEKKKLSAKTIKSIHVFVYKLFQQAVLNGLLSLWKKAKPMQERNKLLHKKKLSAEFRRPRAAKKA